MSIADPYIFSPSLPSAHFKLKFLTGFRSRPHLLMLFLVHPDSKLKLDILWLMLFLVWDSDILFSLRPFVDQSFKYWELEESRVETLHHRSPEVMKYETPKHLFV
jgi:hypothetical protein